MNNHMTSMQQKLQVFSITKKIKQSVIILSLIFTCIISYNFLFLVHPNTLIDIDLFTRLLPWQNHHVKTCDYSYGNWVLDPTLPGEQYSENCAFLDPGFHCQFNGRNDSFYKQWRWVPHNCDLPRFEARGFLDRSRNARIVFVGDSIGRNQWESFICMLAKGVSNNSRIYEESGNPITKHKGFLSIKFQEYNLTVQYYRVPYLVVIDHPPPDADKVVRGAIRVDKLHWFSTKWVGADVLIFSAGHWWNRDKTLKSGHYFQEGKHINMTMDVMEAFRTSLKTLKLWMMKNLDTDKSHVFFRSYSPVHFRDGKWNSGGHCNTSTEPETNYTKLESEHRNNLIIYKAVEQMKGVLRHVHFLNITYLTEFRKDGHPSSHREPGTPVNAPQDCSHWCLPGVPDTWNEILFKQLLTMGFRTRPTLQQGLHHL